MIFIRHGAPARSDVCYGHSDPALAVTAEETARSLRAELSQQPGPWHSSPAQRCLSVARLLAPQDQVIPVEALRELSFGDWEQTPWSSIDRSALDAWARQPLDFRIPGGESGRDLFHRVQSWVTRDPLSEHSVVVAHAGSLRALAAILMEQPFERTWQWPVPYGTALSLNARGTGFDLWAQNA